ncbi:Oxoglutarate/iron-dependent dioxygenase [uncultured Caudovirales phage]|uniref:Oxoglutarate/iron-dependent dioxygenase n=1 Tax=uncultured Caudovirales phage TaxID=2100421 RepID=A0A6J5LNK8_9CAUD|nr:Oxoglutarate/iron-dependent dioxygenase [uncultured Caudovirales phage]
MGLQVFNDPVPYVVIDNFLGTIANKELLGEIHSNEYKLQSAEIINYGVREVDATFRKNLTWWLDDVDDATISVAGKMNRYFFHKDLVDVVGDIPELLHLTGSMSRSHNMVISRYAESDFYKWHVDIGGHVTWNYFFYHTPRKFTGGDFVLSNSLYEEEITQTTTIDCVNDRLVIFPSCYQHCVTPVESKGLTGVDCRHSLQVFFT